MFITQSLVVVALCLGLASLSLCQNSPCDYTKCGYGANCEEVDGKATCVCPSICPEIYQPVCADGVTYSNECFLRVANCNAKRSSTNVSSGACKTTGGIKPAPVKQPPRIPKPVPQCD